MGAETKIEWTHHTFNHVRGCTKVSPGCAHCYAETMSGRNPGTLGVWGPQGKRVVAAESYWRLPVKWNKAAAKAGERHRVFCASLADVFEDWNGSVHDAQGDVKTCHVSGIPIDLDAVRRRLFDLIDATPNLDWLLLTKRPENIRGMWPQNGMGEHVRTHPSGFVVRNNVWLGVSVEDQQRAEERIEHLLKTPAVVRFLSIEPLLGPVDLSEWMYTLRVEHNGDGDTQEVPCRPDIHWVIVGGESGHGCRPCRPGWIRSLVKQCQAANVPVFVKQLGGNVVTRNDMVSEWLDECHAEMDVEHDIHGFREDYQGADCRVRLRDKKGGDMAEFPPDLRIREYPEARSTR